MATAAARDAQPTESPGGDARVGDRVRDPRRDARLRRLILAVVALATAAPLLWVRYLPFTDLPEHVAAIATLARLLPGGGGSTDFVLSLRESQYLVYDLVGALLTRALGDAALANRLLLAAVAVAWPFSLVALLRALDRDERVALFAPMIFWNRALTIGFLPFVASVPLAVFALATLVRQLEAPTKRGHALVAALAIVLFYTHVSAYVLFAFAGGVMTIVRLRRTWRSAARLLAMLVPSGVLAAVWWLAGSLGSARSPAGPSGRLAHTGRTAVDAVPLWAFDVWRSHLDELWASLWWIAFALVVIAGLKRKPDSASIRAGLFALVPLACALLIYALTPFHVGPAGYLDVRLAPLLALFSLLLLRPSPGRAGDGQVALAVVAALGTACTAAYEMQRVEHEMLGELDALLAKMKPGSRLATLNFEVESKRMYFWPYVFAGSYHRTSGGITSYSFTELPHWPIHYAPGRAPPIHNGFWIYSPCEFRYRLDGEYYDYVLLQGRGSPFEETHPGPEFTEVARAGAFILFAKEPGGDALPSLPDRSPCAPRIGPPALP